MGDERRARGRPARISREQIVAAARRAPGPELTMQAVADELGVSRKALHYYVGNRQGLLTLVVVDRFESELKRVHLPDDGDWRVVLRAYAHAYRDGIVRVGVQISSAADHTPFRGVAAVEVLALAERVLAALLAAQNAMSTSLRDVHQAESRAALERTPAADYPALRLVLDSAPRPDEGQFEFELDLAIAGLEQLLRGGGP